MKSGAGDVILMKIYQAWGQHGGILLIFWSWYYIRSTTWRVGTQRWEQVWEIFLISHCQGRITERYDYDIALLRIDYPIMDEGTGITVLEVFKSCCPPLSRVTSLTWTLWCQSACLKTRGNLCKTIVKSLSPTDSETPGEPPLQWEWGFRRRGMS